MYFPPRQLAESRSMASSPIDSVEVLSKVITAQPKTNSEVAPIPFNHVCPCCNQRITTEVLYRPNSKTHLTATLLCVAYEKLNSERLRMCTNVNFQLLHDLLVAVHQE
ncbi:Hypothetical predicted protein [Cloeon dipterum]|uniref:LITAF domain-containing protein n=1 Tax=Cloeon dipterum TaxID=197152 RepID=A0A8S1DJQ9_9INSE|nr:Hypothetical predicted protein [Cloeon dipterum]